MNTNINKNYSLSILRKNYIHQNSISAPEENTGIGYVMENLDMSNISATLTVVIVGYLFYD